MALLTVAELMDDVLDEVPGKEQAPITRAANKVIRRIHTEVVAPVRGTVTTKAQVTTGTVSVTQGSTTATFSSGVVLAADPLRLVRIQGDTTWFVLTRGAADTDGVLSSDWAEATNGTATFEICYPAVTFPSDVGELLEMWRTNEEKLDFRTGIRVPITAGRPRSWGPYQHDSSSADPDNDRLRVVLDPAPQAAEAYTYWAKPRATFLDPAGADTQTIPFSDLWYDAITQGVLMYMWKQEGDKKKIMTQNALYEGALDRARGSQLPAAVIPPRRVRGGVWAYEERPYGG